MDWKQFLDWLSQIDWKQTLDGFNTLTAPIGFFLTIFTFYFARATKNKLIEEKELAIFELKQAQYIGRLEAIKTEFDSVEGRNNTVPERVMYNTLKLISEIKTSYPTRLSKRDDILKTFKDIEVLGKKENVIAFEFLKPFNALCAIFLDGEGIK